MALLDAAIAFFIPYYSIVEAGQNSITDVYSVGKVVFICLLSAVTLEICVIARYWTWPFLIFVFLSYWLVYPFEIVFPAIEKGISYYDPGQWGVGENVFRSPTFWFVQITVALTCFGHRYLERAVVWLFHPQDNMILEEMESQQDGPDEMGWQTKKRLNMLGVPGVTSPGPKVDPENPEAVRSLMNGHSHSDAAEHMHPLPKSNGTSPYGTTPYDTPNGSAYSSPRPPVAPGTLPKSNRPSRDTSMVQALDDDRERQAGMASQAYYADQPNEMNVMDEPQVAPFDMPAELEMTNRTTSGNPFAQSTLPMSTAWQ